jgi:cytochrome P450
VVHEILRIAPTSAASSRDCVEDTALMGKRIPKGTMLITMNHMVAWKENESRKEEVEGRVRSVSGRKVGWWKGGDQESREFQPDRWLNEKGEFDPKRGVWVPFGVGGRSCFGKNLAVSRSNSRREVVG